jgi:lipid A 3-O-deacylase
MPPRRGGVRAVTTFVAVVVVAGVHGSARADHEVQGLAAATAIVLLAELWGDAPKRAEPDWIAFEGGAFDPIKNERESAEFGLEYRLHDFLFWKIKPFVGAGGTTNGSFFGYGGVRVDTYWGPHMVITPSFAVVGYNQGNGKDLGNPAVLGRFGIDLQYDLPDEIRLGVAFHHMSNGKVFGQQSNPGTELIGLTLAIPWR